MRAVLKRTSFVVAMLLIALVAVACQPAGGTATDVPPVDGGDGGGTAAGDPTDAARAYVEALFTGDADALRASLCESQAEQADALAEAMAGAPAGVEVTYDFSGVTYTASDVTDTTANVTVGGEATVTTAGVDTPMPMTGVATLPMAVENGAWKVCPPTG